MTPEEFIQREDEVQKAARAYPDLEMGAAYALWKESRGERASRIDFSDETIPLAKHYLMKLAERPCDQADCAGTQFLEAVCPTCVEGKAGYHTRWVCSTCFHRTLSREDYVEALKRLVKEGEKNGPAV
jgi:hypothetical protein